MATTTMDQNPEKAESLDEEVTEVIEIDDPVPTSAQPSFASYESCIARLAKYPQEVINAYAAMPLQVYLQRFIQAVSARITAMGPYTPAGATNEYERRFYMRLSSDMRNFIYRNFLYPPKGYVLPSVSQDVINFEKETKIMDQFQTLLDVIKKSTQENTLRVYIDATQQSLGEKDLRALHGQLVNRFKKTDGTWKPQHKAPKNTYPSMAQREPSTSSTRGTYVFGAPPRGSVRMSRTQLGSSQLR